MHVLFSEAIVCIQEIFHSLTTSPSSNSTAKQRQKRKIFHFSSRWFYLWFLGLFRIYLLQSISVYSCIKFKAMKISIFSALNVYVYVLAFAISEIKIKMRIALNREWHFCLRVTKTLCLRFVESPFCYWFLFILFRSFSVNFFCFFFFKWMNKKSLD